ncbi:c-type cytochrome [Zeimonas arvi]|uniref:Cytochrome c n=1 Tax=Zeimonas arvi TaxID=2498847 RepID=A0A5C8P2E1_9BURK|nr:cytochrome c [Zeimonas arvi]TXL67376.1 cytochrome c [Zeimonas arvi]
MTKLSKLKLAAALSVAGFAVLASPAVAGDIAKGKEKADQVCAACHGKDGNTPIDPSYPKLAGQFRDYLETALTDYQAERRTNAIMVGQAKALSRDDIRNLAAYYASLPTQLSVRR